MEEIEVAGESDKPKEKPIIIRNTTDLQRLKLEKLMKNPVSKILRLYLLLSLIFYFRKN